MNKILSQSPLLGVLAFSCLVACQSGLSPKSSRDIGGIDKAGGVVGNSRPIEGAESQDPEIFVRKKQIVIDPHAEPNTTGSLFNLQDERNFLYGYQGPQSLGKYLTVQVDTNKLGVPKGGAAGVDQAASAAGGKSGLGPVESAILASLPNLAPPAEGASLINSFKMRVAQVFENGDVLAVVKRTSILGGQGHEIVARARIPYEKLGEGQPITTNDLFEVQWLESSKGELVERFSHGWEDVYTARLSGFEEAKSRQAMELDDKRKQLEQAKSKMEQQLVSLGKERQVVAKAQEDARSLKFDSENKVQALESKLKDSEELIEKQKEELESLKKQSESPGDKKDGASGV